MGRGDYRSRSRSAPRRRMDSRGRSPPRRRGRGRSDSRGRGSSRGMIGVVVTWNFEKGFGFIKPDRGGDDLFAHVSGLKDGDALREGDEVRFDKSWDDRHDKYRAENVTGAVRERDIRRRSGSRGRGRSGSRGRGGREVCRQYQRRGSCDWGDRCRFEH